MFLIDAAAFNSYVLYKKDNSHVSRYAFLEELASQLIHTQKEERELIENPHWTLKIFRQSYRLQADLKKKLAGENESVPNRECNEEGCKTKGRSNMSTCTVCLKTYCENHCEEIPLCASCAGYALAKSPPSTPIKVNMPHI